MDKKKYICQLHGEMTIEAFSIYEDKILAKNLEGHFEGFVGTPIPEELLYSMEDTDEEDK